MNWYSKIIESSILPLGDFILNTSFIGYLKYYRHLVQQDQESLEFFQRDRLIAMLQYASTKSSYYHKWRVDLSGTVDQCLQGLPVMDKDTLRRERDNLLTQPIENLIECSSSGSSGKRSVVYITKKEESEQRAIQMLWWIWAGYQFGDRLIQTGMTSRRGLIKGVKDILFRTRYVHAFSLDQNEILDILTPLRKSTQFVLAGYASSLYLFAKTAIDHDIQDISFKSIICWGDNLFPHYRKALEKIFKSRVFETYGTAEGLRIAAQKDLEFMYYMTPAVYLELLDDHNRPVPDGEIGHVVITNLISKAMPLIRFKIGDLAIRLPINEYPPNRSLALPLLKKVIGRDTDIIKTTSGKMLTVHSFTGIFEHIPEINQFRVIQNVRHGIEIEYISGEGFNSEILENIKRQILSHLNEPFSIQFKPVLKIPDTPSGKPQLVKSHLY